MQERYKEESHLKNESEQEDEKVGFKERGSEVCMDEWKINCDRQKGRRET